MYFFKLRYSAEIQCVAAPQIRTQRTNTYSRLEHCSSLLSLLHALLSL